MDAQTLPGQLNEDRLARFVDALRRTYEECRARFDREVGFDSQTFGQMTYKSSWFYLETYSRDDVGVQVIRDGNSFELDIEGIRLHPFKIGHQDGDIYRTFPSNEDIFNFMAERNIEQLSLLPDSSPRFLVLAHAGNPTDGLRAVYIAAPGSAGSWASIVRIDGLESRVRGPESVEVELPDLEIIAGAERPRARGG